MKSMFVAYGSWGTKPFCKDEGGKQGEKLQVCYASWKVWGEGRGLVDLFQSGRRGRGGFDLYQHGTCVIMAIKTIGFHNTLDTGSGHTAIQQVKKVRLAMVWHSDGRFCFALGLSQHFLKNQHDSELGCTSVTSENSLLYRIFMEC